MNPNVLGAGCFCASVNTLELCSGAGELLGSTLILLGLVYELCQAGLEQCLTDS